MNILFVDQFPTIGGGQRSMLELLPLVRRRGWKAVVALPRDGALADRVRESGVEVDWVPCGTYTAGSKTIADFASYAREVLPMGNALSSLAAKHRIGLLYVSGPRLLPAAAWLSRRSSIPLVFHCHHRIRQPLAAALAGESLRWARARIIACCRFACEPLAPYARHCRVIYNGVAAPRWSRRGRDPMRPWKIGVIGRVEPEKGQMEFVAAARIVAAEYGNCSFVIAGAPLFSGPEYMNQVRRASRGLPIQFPGWQEDIGPTFSQLDLLVVPSTDFDSTPRVVIEAFAGGVPVLAFPAGGIPEILQDSRIGYLATRQTPEALAARICSVLSRGLRQMREVSDRALTEWQERYTLERFQDEVECAITESAVSA